MEERKGFGWEDPQGSLPSLSSMGLGKRLSLPHPWCKHSREPCHFWGLRTEVRALFQWKSRDIDGTETHPTSGKVTKLVSGRSSSHFLRSLWYWRRRRTLTQRQQVHIFCCLLLCFQSDIVKDEYSGITVLLGKHHVMLGSQAFLCSQLFTTPILYRL